MKTYVVFVVMAYSLSLTIGCATVGTLLELETKNKIYSGTIRHFKIQCNHGACLDFPFSLALDTAILPVTIPVTIFNFTHDMVNGNSETE